MLFQRMTSPTDSAEPSQNAVRTATELGKMNAHRSSGLEGSPLGGVADGVRHQGQTPVLLRAAKKRSKVVRTPVAVMGLLAQSVKT
jgi:hypothetical protein